MVFPYSVREGTAAAGFPNRVSPKEIAERAEKMNELAKYLEYRFLQDAIFCVLRFFFLKRNIQNKKYY